MRKKKGQGSPLCTALQGVPKIVSTRKSLLFCCQNSFTIPRIKTVLFRFPLYNIMIQRVQFFAAHLHPSQSLASAARLP